MALEILKKRTPDAKERLRLAIQSKSLSDAVLFSFTMWCAREATELMALVGAVSVNAAKIIDKLTSGADTNSLMYAAHVASACAATALAWTNPDESIWDGYKDTFETTSFREARELQVKRLIKLIEMETTAHEQL